MNTCRLPPEILRQIAEARRIAQAPYDAALLIISGIDYSPVQKTDHRSIVTSAELRAQWPDDRSG